MPTTISRILQEPSLWAVLFLIVLLPVAIKLIRKRQKAPDPLNEAKIYLAYGQKKQALALLEAAIKVSPDRGDIAAKISELKQT